MRNLGGDVKILLIYMLDQSDQQMMNIYLAIVTAPPLTARVVLPAGRGGP